MGSHSEVDVQKPAIRQDALSALVRSNRSILRRLILSDDTSAFLETPLDTERSAKAKPELKCHQDLYPSKRLVYWDIKSIYFLKSKG